MSFCVMASASTAAATDTAISASAFQPNIITAATAAGASAIHTSNIMRRVELAARR